MGSPTSSCADSRPDHPVGAWRARPRGLKAKSAPQHSQDHRGRPLWLIRDAEAGRIRFPAPAVVTKLEGHSRHVAYIPERATSSAELPPSVRISLLPEREISRLWPASPSLPGMD